MPAVCDGLSLDSASTAIEDFEGIDDEWDGASSNFEGSYWSSWTSDPTKKRLPTPVSTDWSVASGDAPAGVTQESLSTTGADGTANGYNVASKGTYAGDKGGNKYIGVSVNLNQTGDQPCPTMVSEAFSGITFYYHSDALVRLNLGTMDTIGAADGGLCTDGTYCYSHYGYTLPSTSGNWEEVSIIWEGDADPANGIYKVTAGWAGEKVPFEPDNLAQLALQIKDDAVDSAFSFGIDEINFIPKVIAY
jgi:hypothetical protein